MSEKGLSGKKLWLMNIVYILVAIVVISIFQPFRGSGLSADEVAFSFLQSIERGDYEEAKEYVTEETVQHIENLEYLSLQPEFRSVVIIGTYEYDDWALVDYKVGADGHEYTLSLAKESREWKVETTKESLKEGGMLNEDESEIDTIGKDDYKELLEEIREKIEENNR